MQVKFTSADGLDVQRFCKEEEENEGKVSDQHYSSASYGFFLVWTMVARGRFELPSMGLFLVRESKAHHWPGHIRPLLVHYTTGLQETGVTGQDPISLLRDKRFKLSIIIGIVR